MSGRRSSKRRGLLVVHTDIDELTASGVNLSGDCEFCFACIQNCPQKAIQFKRSVDGSFPDGSEKNSSVRYRNEHVSLMVIKMANNQKL